MGTLERIPRIGWKSVRRGQRPYFSSRNVPKSVPRPKSVLCYHGTRAYLYRQREKQPLVPRPSGKKCRRRHHAIGNVNLAAGPLDNGEAGKIEASECNFGSVAIGDRLGIGITQEENATPIRFRWNSAGTYLACVDQMRRRAPVLR